MIHNDFQITVHKTQLVEVNDKVHKLPPDLGTVKGYKVADYFCPPTWSKDGYFITLEENQAIYFDFQDNEQCACLPFIQKVNPITLEQINIEKGLSKEHMQNYLVCPDQKWLDGYCNESGVVYQFLITKEGLGFAVSENVLPSHVTPSFAIGFAFYSPKNPKYKPIPTKPSRNYPEVDFEQLRKSLGKQVSQTDDLLERVKRTNQWIPYHYYDPSQDKVIGVSYPEWFYGDSIKVGSSGSTESIWQLSNTNSASTDINTSGGIRGSSFNANIGSINSYSNNKNSNNENVLRARKCKSVTPSQEPFIGMCNVEPIEADSHPIHSANCIGEMSSLIDSDALEFEIGQKHAEFEKASVGGGGRIAQKLYTDINSVDFYKEKPDAIFNIYIALPEQFKFIMEQGKRQDSNRKDKETDFANVGGKRFPLLKIKAVQQQVDA